MSKIIITNKEKSGRRGLMQGAIGDYSVPTFNPSRVISVGKPKSTGNAGNEGNKPNDDRLVSDNYESLQNFDEKRIYEGLISYNKEDKTVYYWAGEKDSEGNYVWDKLGGDSEQGEEVYSDKDYPF